MKILTDLTKIYRKHKKVINIGGIIIIGCLLVYGFIGFFTDNTTSPIYGNRLDGINKVKLTRSDLKDAGKNIEKEGSVLSAKVRLEGKTIYLDVIVKKGTSLDDAKKVTSKITSEFDEKEVKFYDFEIFVENEDEGNKSFPIIAHKKADRDNFSWTKNR